MTNSERFRIAVLAGDGIGREVIPAAIEVVEKAAAGACALDFVEFPWGCEFYRRHGRMMSADALETLQGFDAIYLGAIGDPVVPDHVSVWELILPIRQRFDHLGIAGAHDRIVSAIERVLANDGPRTPDLGGTATTGEGARAVAEAV